MYSYFVVKVFNGTIMYTSEMDVKYNVYVSYCTRLNDITIIHTVNNYMKHC